jgi:replication factor C subunit 1
VLPRQVQLTDQEPRDETLERQILLPRSPPKQTFSCLQVNASDARGKADKDVGKGMGGSTSNQVKELITNRSVSGSGKKIALIMDEVDGMSGGDRGGVTDLIQSIQKSKIPIICICNDKYNQKIKSLVGHCMELNFQKPSKQQIARRLGEVAGKEGMHVEEVRGFGVYGFGDVCVSFR